MLQALLTTLAELSRRVSVVLLVHPRSRNMIERFALNAIVEENPVMRLVDPLGCLDFLNCMNNAKVVITNSGGIQEEATALGAPCITVRDNTERPVTVAEGTNVVVGRDSDAMLQEALAVLEGRSKTGGLPELWDGKASRRIVKILAENLQGVGSGAGAGTD